jgi:RIO kinase 1
MGKGLKLKGNKGGEDGDYDTFDAIESSLLNEELKYSNVSKSISLFGLDLDRKINLSTKVQNDITRSEKKSEKRPNYYGRDDRATSEQVLDPRTRLILFKLLSNGFLEEIDGCLSTGKEANVYYGRGKHGQEYAIKIFKTSILVFKDRDKYVSGEFRFRGYCKSNPRKMVKTWAEKEMRNLKRLANVGISSPLPYLLKSHVLIMQFLGENGWCASRLKDATLSNDEFLACYKSIVMDMRRMFQDCNLVHGDLSEYNLLYHQGKPVIIDVSQSVEQSHPFASDFLRKDVSNVTDFFSKKGLQILSKMSLFQYIIDKEPMCPPGILSYSNDLGNTMTEDGQIISSKVDAADRLGQNKDFQSYLSNLQSKLDQMLEQTYIEAEEIEEAAKKLSSFGRHEEQFTAEELQAKREVDEAVFLQAFIPTRLSEISNPYKELERLKAGGREKVFESAVMNMISTGVKVQEIEEEERKDESEGDSESEDEAELRALIAKLTTPSSGAAVNEGCETAAVEDITVELSKDKKKKQKDNEDNGSGDENSDDCDDEDNDDDDTSDSEGNDEDDDGYEENKKYRRKLPSRDNPDERLKEKEARKQARKEAKEGKANKRKNKIPKHVKKRAMKNGKK